MADCSMVSGHIDRETNYDRIRKMSPEEMAIFIGRNNMLCKYCACYGNITRCQKTSCIKGVQQWLDQEAEK